MDALELVLRSMAALQWLCLAAVLWLRRERLAAWLPLGLAAFMVTSAPGADAWLAAALRWPLTLLCVANPVWFWLLGEALFADTPRWDARWIVPMALIVAAGLWHETAAPGSASAWVRAAHALGAVAVVVATMARVLRGKADDLVEPRRRWRSWFVLGIGAYGLLAMALLAWFGGRLPAPLAQANIAGLLVAGVALNLWLVARAATLAPTTATKHLRGVDAALVERIGEAMQVQHLYRQEGLSVAALARAVGSQEYLVRRAINGHLGCRNFNDFLNRWRLDDAAKRLRSQPQRPILSIALDVGYGSIGPFNRAFKARFGMTPSEYRGQPGCEHGSVERSPKAGPLGCAPRAGDTR
jgi:AraC-like DNA-binding protein